MFQLNQLREKVREVSDTFPWYRSLIGKRPEEVQGPEDLPLITPEILERHYYHHPWGPPYSVYRTSGTSSGRRKAIAYSAEDDEHYVNIKVKLFSRLLAGSGSTRALADMGTGHAASTAKIVFERMGLTCRSIPFELPVEQHIAELQAFRPDVLYTMPSILERIAAAAGKDACRTFGLRKIILVGEIASPEWQRGMASRFGISPCDIIDTYGSIEIGTLAYFDHDLGRYLLAEGLIAEGIGIETIAGQTSTESAGTDGSEQILVLTSFVRTMFPALRFVTCDVVRDLRPVVVDGEERQSFLAIVRRVGPELKHGEKISLYDIEAAVFRHAADALIRVETSRNRLTVRIKSPSLFLESPTLSLIRQEIRDRIPEIGMMIRNGLLEEIDVTLSPEDEVWEGGIKRKRIYRDRQE